MGWLEGRGKDPPDSILSPSTDKLANHGAIESKVWARDGASLSPLDDLAEGFSAQGPLASATKATRPK